MSAGGGRCRPAPERALCSVAGCNYADPTGELADSGRDHLRARLRRRSDEGGCSCARCRDDALTVAEVDGVLTHVSDRFAVLLRIGVVQTLGMVRCEDCGQWRIGFAPSATAGPDVLAHTGCPFHPA